MNYTDNLKRQNREKAEKTLLKMISIRCKHCKGKMIPVVDLDDTTMVGYSCEDCPHYNLLN